MTSSSSGMGDPETFTTTVPEGTDPQRTWHLTGWKCDEPVCKDLGVLDGPITIYTTCQDLNGCGHRPELAEKAIAFRIRWGEWPPGVYHCAVGETCADTGNMPPVVLEAIGNGPVAGHVHGQDDAGHAVVGGGPVSTDHFNVEVAESRTCEMFDSCPEEEDSPRPVPPPARPPVGSPAPPRPPPNCGQFGCATPPVPPPLGSPAPPSPPPGTIGEHFNVVVPPPVGIVPPPAPLPPVIWLVPPPPPPLRPMPPPPPGTPPPPPQVVTLPVGLELAASRCEVTDGRSVTSPGMSVTWLTNPRSASFSYTLTRRIVSGPGAGPDIVNSPIAVYQGPPPAHSYEWSTQWNQVWTVELDADSGGTAVAGSPVRMYPVACFRPDGLSVECVDPAVGPLRVRWVAMPATQYLVTHSGSGIATVIHPDQLLTDGTGDVYFDFPTADSITVTVTADLESWTGQGSSFPSETLTWSGECGGVDPPAVCADTTVNMYIDANSGGIRFAESAYAHDREIYSGEAVVASEGQMLIEAAPRAIPCPAGWSWVQIPTIVGISIDKDYSICPAWYNSARTSHEDGVDWALLGAALVDFTIQGRATFCAHTDLGCAAASACDVWRAPTAGAYVVTVEYARQPPTPAPTVDEPNPAKPPVEWGSFEDLVFIDTLHYIQR